MLEALAFTLVVLALGFPVLITAMFGSDQKSDRPANRRTVINVEPQSRRPVSCAFEVMSPPLWLM
jgi:hypothetical protein